MKSPSPIPPRLARFVLLRFLRSDLAEEVEGDLEEKYITTLKEKTPFRANINYWYQVIQYFRPFAIKKLSHSKNHHPMIRNYFRIGWRNLTRQKMYSAIKIGGFALGIAACLLIALFIRDELSYDLQYPNGDRIFRAVGVFDDNGTLYQDTWFAAPFGKVIQEDYPEIEMVARLNTGELFGAGSAEIRRADRTENSYDQVFVYADPEILEMLQWPMVHGDPHSALSMPNSIVLTRSKAEKYFPNEDPVGKLMIINDDEKTPFTVGGVIEDFPSTTHFQYDFLITMKNREFWPGEQTYWRASNYHTYILLKSGVDPKEFESKLSKGTIEKYFLPSMIESGVPDAEKMMAHAHIELQPLHDIHLNSQVRDGALHGDRQIIWLFGGIAIFILVIACINFINLSTAKSANRAKEVGLRKAVGSFRQSIIYQFLTESMLFSFFSIAIGFLLAWALLPYFNLLSNKTLQFPWHEWWLWPLLIAATLTIGFIAGIYPSFYLSAFKPIQVLKGNLSRGSKHAGARSALVVFQFTTSIVLIVGTFVIYRQMNYVLNAKVGFDKEQVLIIQGANTLDREITTFKKELLQLPKVEHVSISDYLPIRGTKRNGNGFWNEGKVNIDREVNGQMWKVDDEYIKTLGMKIVEGRDFDPNMPTDSGGVIINQAMARALHLSDPIGKVITNGTLWSVIGVVEDFHFESMKHSIAPVVMRLGLSPSIVTVKVNGADMQEVIQSVTDVWKKFTSTQPLRYTFLDESYARMYDDVQRTGRIFTSFAILAIIVACLGLFALSAFMVEQRSKEISIRLVLGASVGSVFGLLTGNFLRLVLISFVIAIPIGWYLMQRWLEDYVYKTNITWEVFAFSGLIAGVIALVTISYQSLRAGLINPVNNLRSE